MSKQDNRAFVADLEDELETYLAEAGKDPSFRAAYEDAEDRHRIVDRLIALRHHHRLTQTAVAKRMGVRQSTVSGFETEDSDPRLSTLQRYARAVGARLRMVPTIPNECDWIVGSSAYSGSSPQGTADVVAIRTTGELAPSWYAERRGERWTKPA